MSGLTAERLQELRRIAEAATPGPWAFPHQKDPYGCYLLPLSENNASYIAAFDPATALALLDEIDHLRKQRDTLISATSNIAGNVLALLDRIEELEAVLRLVYDEFVLDVARWCRHCRLRIDDHEPECPMAEVERVLGLAGGATDA